MRRLRHLFDRSRISSASNFDNPIPAETKLANRIETPQRPLQPDDCSCCKLPKTSSKTAYWDGTLEDLTKASQSGCLRCSLVLQCISRFIDGVDHRRSRFRAWASFNLIELRLKNLGTHESGERSIALDVIAGDEPNLTIFQDIKRRPLLPGSTSSITTFQQICSWISECDKTHKSCARIASGNSQMPDRILELREDHIVLREGLVGPFSYACLSHCWGPCGDVLQTRQQDIASYAEGISADELSENFRDAVEICRRLEISYLWIDSLCIIQDSEQDLQKQLSKMASIYENACLTIAATKARHTNEGCFGTTDSEFMASVVNEIGLLVRQRPPEYPTHWSNRTADRWPLLTRGWIYQEMRLSRRVIHFCQQEVIWECNERRYSESGRSDERLDDASRFRNAMHEYVPYSLMMDDPVRLWYRTVQEYSRLSLSFEKDKLPALSALTQKMQIMRRNSRFLAGLWEDSLILDLLWIAWPRPDVGRHTIARGPTWSWLAVQTQVMWEGTIKSVLDNVRVLDLRYVTSGLDITPVIHEATITFCAPLLRARIREHHKLELDPGSPRGLAIYDWKEDYNYSISGEHHVPADTEVFLAPLAYTEMNHSHVGLILRAVGNTNKHQRVGRVELRHATTIEFDSSEPSNRLESYQQIKDAGEKRDRLRDQVTEMLTNLRCRDFELI